MIGRGVRFGSLSAIGGAVFVLAALGAGDLSALAGNCERTQHQSVGGLDKVDKGPAGMYSKPQQSAQGSSWYQPKPQQQRPYVAPPKKRYVPLGGDSTGPVIVLPGGNGPQND